MDCFERVDGVGFELLLLGVVWESFDECLVDGCFDDVLIVIECCVVVWFGGEEFFFVYIFILRIGVIDRVEVVCFEIVTFDWLELVLMLWVMVSVGVVVVGWFDM